MKAQRLLRPAPVATRPLELTELPVPVPAPHELLVRVRACAVCRTDLHVVEGELPQQRLPLVPGHQVAGVVARAGAAVDGFAPGDRVGVAWLRQTCGRCSFCRSGAENLCAESRYTGYHADGGYAEYCLIDAAYAYRLPDGIDDLHAAPLLCAGIIGYRALQRAELPAGGRLLLYGFGSSAHIVLQLARQRGCTVLVATRSAGHRALAQRLGAAWTGDSFDPPPEPADSAIVFAPAGEIVPAALAAVRPGGTVALAGIYMTPLPALDYERHLFHEKNLRSVEAATRADGRALLAAAAAAGVRATVTPYPLERAGEALIDLREDRIDGTAVLTF
jgi:propanol-preferring alcohol dehydrogenase